MLKYSLATIALLASTSFALAQDMDRGDKGSGASNSATEHAPGQMKDSGSAKDIAPGRRRKEPLPRITRLANRKKIQQLVPMRKAGQRASRKRVNTLET